MLGISGYGAYTNFSYGMQGAVSGAEEPKKVILNPGEPTNVTPGKKVSPAQCETCRNRKYQDGSNEMVSFKAAAHISPAASAGVVRSHEQEHVNNAYEKASKNNGVVLQASVTLKTAICPECGRAYVEGGNTSTVIKYTNEDPYTQNKKSSDVNAVLGQNVDMAV